MPRSTIKLLEFPLGGVDSSTAIQTQKPYTTPLALNVWPFQWSTGRGRGGTRPGLTAFQSTIGDAPQNWCPATWVSGTTTYRGVAVSNTNGCWVSTGGAWVEAITNAATSNFNSCCMYNNYLVFARFGQTALVRLLTTPGSGAGTEMTAGWSAGQIEGSDGGTPPADCGLVCRHMGRLVLAGSQAAPHTLSMSRAGYFDDWDYAQTDRGAAWQSAGSASASIGEPITSLIPHNENCLIVGCTDSLYVLKGNPMAGGYPEVLSQDVGPVMQSAWAKTGNGWTYFMSRNGLYRFPPGCPSQSPEEVSRGKLPEVLVGIEPADGDTVALGYDSRWLGLHIYVNRNTGTDHYYFYDLVNEGFWPMSFSSSMRLAINHKVADSLTESALLAMTTAGQAYQFVTTSTESMDSYYVYGPIQLAGPGLEGILSEITAVLAANSSAVSWKLYVGDSAAKAHALLEANSASYTGTDWSVGGSSAADYRLLQYNQTPRLRGKVAYLKVYGETTERIALEEVQIICQDAGMRRAGAGGYA